MWKSIRVSCDRAGRPALAVSLRAAAAATTVCAAFPAGAHGFGQRYDLPLPLWLYLWATAAAIVLSFVVAALFLRAPTRDDAYPRIELLGAPGRVLASRWLALALQLCSLALFIIAVAAGFFGNSNPYQNIAPTLVWVIAWVGLAYVSAFIGNLWPLVNPWRTLFAAAESCYRHLRAQRDLSLRLSYPERLGVLPAFALLFAFSWLELVSPSPALPLHIAWFATGYSILTWVGMFVFGGEAWLQHGEVFTVVFETFARFSPTEVRRVDGSISVVALRPYAAGLLDRRPVSSSMTAFVLLILATVLYDGALATPEWNELELRLIALAPAGFGDASSIAIRTVGLGAFWLALFGAFMAICAMMSAVAGKPSTWELARRFAMTLVPIAIAYHLAHYLVYLVVQGQYIVPLLSDPFGRGWNLFGTAGYRVDIGIVGARFAWYTAVIAILIGHVVAVFLAHRRALQLFDTRRTAFGSQIPLTALMVAYTFLSLTILAEPITERAAAQPTASVEGVTIPADAVLPQPGSGRLQPLGMGKLAREKLTYRVLGSAFHDGSKLSAADLLYAYMFAYRWGVRSESEPTHYDPRVDTATAPLRDQLAAVKIVGTDSVSKSFRVGDVNVVRELLIIDVYLGKAPEDPEQDAAIAPPWSTVPWHVLVLMEEAAARGWAAFSQAEAARTGVEWLDLARSDRLNRQLASLVETFEHDGYRPESLQSLVSADEARKRWSALGAFYKVHGHFLVTNGPYVLKHWSAEGVDLDVFRDLSYPLGVGSYDAYAIPRRGFVTGVERDKDGLRLSAEIETIMKFQRSYEIQREALQKVEPDVLKRSAPECRYAVLDSAGSVVLAGVVRPAADATFRVDVPAKLAPGSYTVLAEIVVAGNAMNADIRRIPLLVTAAPS